LLGHFEKHGAEFEARCADDYFRVERQILDDEDAEAVGAHAWPAWHVGHRVASFGRLLDRFNLEFFRLALGVHLGSFWTNS
jgi:hypothetical protein